MKIHLVDNIVLNIVDLINQSNNKLLTFIQSLHPRRQFDDWCAWDLPIWDGKKYDEYYPFNIHHVYDLVVFLQVNVN